MLDLSPTKLLIIFVVVVVLLGPKRLPEVARQLGAGWRKLRELHGKLDSELRRTMPDLPTSQEIVRFARSPITLLNQLADHTDEPSSQEGPGGTASDGVSSNGAASSGAASNGAASSGAASNGAASRGAASNGAASSGAASNGAASSGAASSGAASSGAASSGIGSGAAAPRRAVPTRVPSSALDADDPNLN